MGYSWPFSFLLQPKVGTTPFLPLPFSIAARVHGCRTAYLLIGVTWLKEIAAKSSNGVLLFRDRRYVLFSCLIENLDGKVCCGLAQHNMYWPIHLIIYGSGVQYMVRYKYKANLLYTYSITTLTIVLCREEIVIRKLWMIMRQSMFTPRLVLSSMIC
jgi:hypothetical protein